MCSAVPDSHADGAAMGETDGRGDPPASTFPGQRSTDRTIRRGSAPVHGLAEAGVGSGEGSRRAAAGPATSAAVPQLPPRAPAPSWRRVLATTIGLWVSRRLPSVGARWWPSTGRPGSTQFRWPARPPRRPSARSLGRPILFVALMVTAWPSSGSPERLRPPPGHRFGPARSRRKLATAQPDPAPWLGTMAAGLLLITAGAVVLRRSRRSAATVHK
jgi:hypothetical protein